MTGDAMNEVVQVKTVTVENAQSPTHAMMIAVNIDEPATVDAFVAHVMEQFRMHRMLAPPTTTMMLITLIGDLSAEVFATKWRALIATDSISGHFVAQMQVADVVQGTAQGRQLSQSSLI